MVWSGSGLVLGGGQKKNGDWTTTAVHGHCKVGGACAAPGSGA